MVEQRYENLARIDPPWRYSTRRVDLSRGISVSSVSGFTRQRKQMKIGLEHQERSSQISLLNAHNHQ